MVYALETIERDQIVSIPVGIRGDETRYLLEYDDGHAVQSRVPEIRNMTASAAPTVARSADRRRTLKAGVIAYSGRHVTLQCAVRDLSDTGARLLVEGSIDAPDTFELIIAIDGMEADCRVAWRRGKEVGVVFVGGSRRSEKKRTQVIAQWTGTAKPTLRRQPKAV